MTRLPAAPTGELTEQPVLILDLLAKVGLQKNWRVNTAVSTAAGSAP
ncbi:hypothetical protein ACFXMT_53210 [Streptomyces mirabilis]|nr:MULTISPECIES: hypothetical protein [unclassified Streptomyces]